MKVIKCFSFLLFVILASGVIADHRGLIDPWREEREACRKQCGLTERDLIKAENDLQKIKIFMGCFGKKLGNINKDGTLNKKATLKNIVTVTPLIIAKPMLDCCIEKVYKGKHPNADEVDELFTDFVACWRDSLPRSMWRVIGTLAPPVYPRLHNCQMSKC